MGTRLWDGLCEHAYERHTYERRAYKMTAYKRYAYVMVY